MANKQIIVPDIGDFGEVEIIEVLVAVGDQINAEDSLITVESDKASMEIPSSDSGTVTAVSVAIGDMISEGSVVIELDVSESSNVNHAEASSSAPEKKVAESVAAPTPKEKLKTPKPSPTAVIDEVTFSTAYASPSVRRFARELGVDLSNIKGSGRKDRILRDDVKGFVKKAMQSPTQNTAGNSGGLNIPAMPEVDFSKWGEIETITLSKINKLTGEFLHRNWVSIPHVTQYDEADITEMEAFRKKMGSELKGQKIKITPLAFIVKAVVASLKAFPRFNSSLDVSKQNLIQKNYYHIGVAVDTPNGLVVPVIRNADQKSLVDISNEIRELALKARDKKLKPADMQGGCFSISSLGGIGGTKFTPIINAPEVAILGVSRSKMQPVWNGSDFDARLMLPLSLSYDHRVVDGADGARFTTHLGQMLGDIRRLLL